MAEELDTDLTDEQEDELFQEAATAEVSRAERHASGAAAAGGSDAGDGQGDDTDAGDGAAADAGDGAGEGEGDGAGAGEGDDAGDGAAAGDGDGQGDDAGDAAGAGDGAGDDADAGEGAAAGEAADAGAAAAAAAAGAGDDAGTGADTPSLFSGDLSREESSRLYLELVGDEEVPDPENEGQTVKVADLAKANPDIFAANAIAMNRALSAMHKDILGRVNPAVSAIEAQHQAETLKALSTAVAARFEDHADAGEIIGTDAFETWAGKQSALIQDVMDRVDPGKPATLADADYVLRKFKAETAWKPKAPKATGKERKAADRPRNAAAAAGLRSKGARNAAARAEAAGGDGELTDEQEEALFEQEAKRLAGKS